MEHLEITAKGSHLTLVLNGTKTVDIQHTQFTEGPISLQFANLKKAPQAAPSNGAGCRSGLCNSRHPQRSGDDCWVYGVSTVRSMSS